MNNCNDVQEELQTVNAETEEETKKVPDEESAAAAEENSTVSRKEQKNDKKQVKKLEAELVEANKLAEKTAAELLEQKEQYLRILAEYDNYRKRTQKEKDSIYADAYSDAIRQILPIIDNLELAVKAGGDAAAILSGVELILKTATENLGKLNITAFGETGDPFDPNRHTAVFHVEDDALGENVVAEVLQKGYERDGKIIRYAVVKVAN